MPSYEQMAAEDLTRIRKYKEEILGAVRATGSRVSPSIVAGIISRETRGGECPGLTADGLGDHGNAFGLMQIDKRWHKIKKEQKWNSQENIEQGIGILLGIYSDVQSKFPHWSEDQKMRGALAGYNMGLEKMKADNVDAHTTGGDYSADVTARARFFASNGF